MRPNSVKMAGSGKKRTNEGVILGTRPPKNTQSSTAMVSLGRQRNIELMRGCYIAIRHTFRISESTNLMLFQKTDANRLLNPRFSLVCFAKKFILQPRRRATVRCQRIPAFAQPNQLPVTKHLACDNLCQCMPIWVANLPP